jgi:hypothetical protein
MLTLRDHRSRELFDPWEHLGVKRRRLLEVSWAGVFREYLLECLPVKELAAGFHDGHGRPSKDLSVALGALVLQQLHDLTDQQTTEAVALNIAWHYALDIRHEPMRIFVSGRFATIERGCWKLDWTRCCSAR